MFFPQFLKQNFFKKWNVLDYLSENIGYNQWMCSSSYNVVIIFMFCRIQVSNPQKSLAALGLMLTCMYAGTMTFLI